MSRLDTPKNCERFADFMSDMDNDAYVPAAANVRDLSEHMQHIARPTEASYALDPVVDRTFIDNARCQMADANDWN